MAYLFKKNFFSNGRTNGQTDGRTNGRTVRFYYAPNFIWEHKNSTRVCKKYAAHSFQVKKTRTFVWSRCKLSSSPDGRPCLPDVWGASPTPSLPSPTAKSQSNTCTLKINGKTHLNSFSALLKRSSKPKINYVFRLNRPNLTKRPTIKCVLKIFEKKNKMEKTTV